MNGHDKKNENSYSDRTRSRTENSFKLSDTERYVNNNVGNKDTKARFYSEQVRDYTVSSVSSNTGRNTESSSFYIDRSAFVENERNTDKMSSYDESYRQATVSYDADKRHANRTSEIQRDTYADRKLESSQDSLKISDTDRYVNNNVGDRVAQEQLLSNQLHDYESSFISSSYDDRDSAFQTDSAVFRESDRNTARTFVYDENYKQATVLYDADREHEDRTSEIQRDTYADRKLESSQDSLKVSNADRYVNNNVGDRVAQEQLLSNQLQNYTNTTENILHNNGDSASSNFQVDKTAFLGNEDRTPIYNESYRLTSVSYGASNRMAEERRPESPRGSYEDRKLESSQDSLKVSDTDRYVNNNVGDRVAQEQLLSNQLQNYTNTTENILHNERDNANQEVTYADRKVELAQDEFKLSETDGYANDVVKNSLKMAFFSPGYGYSSSVKNKHNGINSNNTYNGSSGSIRGFEAREVRENTYVDRNLESSQDRLKVSDTEKCTNRDLIVKNSLMNAFSNQMFDREIAINVKNSDTNSGDTGKKSNSSKTGNDTGSSGSAEKKSGSNKTDGNGKKGSDPWSDAECIITGGITTGSPANNGNSVDKEGKSKNILGKTYDAVLRGLDFADNLTDEFKEDNSGNDVMMEGAYAVSGTVAAKAVTGIVGRSGSSIESIESKLKIVSNFFSCEEDIDSIKRTYKKMEIRANGLNGLAQQQALDDYFNPDYDFMNKMDNRLGVKNGYRAINYTLFDVISDMYDLIFGEEVYGFVDTNWNQLSEQQKVNLIKKQLDQFKSTHEDMNFIPTFNNSIGTYHEDAELQRIIRSCSSNGEAFEKVLHSQYEVSYKKKKKNRVKTRQDKARQAYINRITRQRIIKNLIKPQSEQENNMSTGFGSYIASIAKRFTSDFFKGMIKWLIGAIVQIIMYVVFVIAFFVVMLMPILLPIGAAVAVVSALFSFSFGNVSTEQANASYCSTVLNAKYDDFNKASYEWLQNNNNTTMGYKVVYADNCAGVDNFQDTLLLYVIFSADNLLSDSSDDSYLVVDSDSEKAAIDKAFTMLTYADTEGTVRTVHRKTLADVESSLSDNQKKMLELERELVADGSNFDLGGRQVGDYPDDVGIGSDVATSDVGQAVVNLGCQYVGNKYVYGGTDINNGIDCSAFAQYCWRQFGVNLPRTTREQVKCGTAVGSLADARPGDLIFYSHNGTDSGTYHVTIYMGDGKMVHASNSKPYPQGGIKISNVYGQPYKIRRVSN